MQLIEIATITISIITVAIAIYKAAKNGTLLTTVIKGVEASTAPGSRIKTTIAYHAEKAGLKYALHKVVKKITDKQNYAEQLQSFSESDKFLNPGTIEISDEILRIKNEVAIRLFQDWIVDETGYDEKTWENVKQAIENNRLSDRKRFDG